MTTHTFWHHSQGVCEISQNAIRMALIHLSPKKNRVNIEAYCKIPVFAWEQGRLTLLSEASEAIYQGLDIVERQSGYRVREWMVNTDDPYLESIKVRGSTHLNGNHEVFQHEHLREAKTRAFQTLYPQDKHCVYQKESGYLVDRADMVHNPLGICGKELTVVMHLLFSDARQNQNLMRLGDRVRLKFSGYYPTAYAALYGVISDEEMKQSIPFLVMSKYVCHFLYYDRQSIQNYKSFLIENDYDENELKGIREHIQNVASHVDGPWIVTGDALTSDELCNRLPEELHSSVEQRPLRSEHPKLDDTTDACLLGMAYLAKSHETSILRKNIFQTTRDRIEKRVKTFVKEYF